MGRRLVGLALALLALGGVVWAFGLLTRQLPSDTQTPSLVVRGLVGLGVGLVIVLLVRRMMGALTEPPPAPPQKVDATTTDVVYECPVCGTRVRLEVAATAKAPRHCGEEMEASIAGR